MKRIKKKTYYLNKQIKKKFIIKINKEKNKKYKQNKNLTTFCFV